MRLFLLMLVVVLTECCDWLDNIKERKVRMELEGRGLHRQVVLSTHLASVSRFSECRLVYELELPSGMYIDSDSINASMSLSEHVVYSPQRFDVEAPEATSKPQKIWIVLSSLIRKTFVIEDKLSVPVHVRYHAAVEGSGISATASIRTPSIALDCPVDYEPHKLASCPGKRKYDKQGVRSSSPSWVLIEPLDKVLVFASIPVADASLVPIVVGATTVTVLGGLLYVFLATTGKNVKKD